MLSKHLCLLPIGVLSMLAKSANAIENNNFQPQELVSKNGKLDVTLTVDLVSSLNGKQLSVALTLSELAIKVIPY